MKRTKAQVVIVALSSLVVGIPLLWWSTALVAPWNVVVSTLATIVMTIGAVNFVSDLFIQKSVSDDLIGLIQSDRRLIDAGLDGLAKINDADWLELFASDYSVECAVLDPNQFKSLIWPRLIDAAKTRLKSIEIVVVDVAEEESRVRASVNLKMSQDEYATTVARFEEDIARE